ncbi:MAG: hypothetical protein ACM3RX_00705, partial [Methanococcaceae archaeon]
PELLVIVALGNGFILTAMLWGAFIAKLIDRQLKAASAFLVITAGFTFFGIIHSAIPEGSMYLPWQLPSYLAIVPYQVTSAYLLLAAMFFFFSFTIKSGFENAVFEET